MRASQTAVHLVLPPTDRLLDRRRKPFFCTLSTHSRLRPVLIGASIATTSTADVAVYLSLLRDGAMSSSNSSAAAIACDLHPAAYEVSAALVALICTTEPVRTQEAEREVRNGMQVRRGKEAAQRGVVR